VLNGPSFGRSLRICCVKKKPLGKKQIGHFKFKPIRPALPVGGLTEPNPTIGLAADLSTV
jgi:hypothetical protein